MVFDADRSGAHGSSLQQDISSLVKRMEIDIANVLKHLQDPSNVLSADTITDAAFSLQTEVDGDAIVAIPTVHSSGCPSASNTLMRETRCPGL